MILPFSELLEEVTRREKEAGIYPDADVDAFMKVDCLHLLFLDCHPHPPTPIQFFFSFISF